MKKKYLKPTIVILFITIFQSLLYLASKLTSVSISVLKTNLDNSIPLIESFVYFYIIWYLLLLLVPLLMYKKNKMIFYKYVVSNIICIVLASLVFILFPTTIERPEIISNGITENILKLIYFIDTPAYNCFPSIHCIICFLFIYFSIFNESFTVKEKIIVIAHSILIIISTILTKQHVLFDVFGALLVIIPVCILVNKGKLWSYLSKSIEEIK